MLPRVTLVGLVLCIAMSIFTPVRKPISSIKFESIQFYPETEPDIDIFMGNWRESMPRCIFRSRKLPAGSVYRVQANGITPHANINNTSVSKKLMWMMKVPVNNNMIELNKAI